MAEAKPVRAEDQKATASQRVASETKPTASQPSASTPSPTGQTRTATELPQQFGRYRIIERLGKGGMGSVYLAHDSQLDRKVALKVPHFSAEDGPHVLQRFYREARSAATLEHANICPVYDVGRIDGIDYLTMAYIEGRPLSEYIQPEKSLPERQAAAVVRKVAVALYEAHLKGVIHRDLKPANIMINARKEPVIMDFGLAKRVSTGKTDNQAVKLTRIGGILGTPSYMSPEQISGESDEVGPASDIYSLGVILYELLTGRLPFEGPMAAVLGQIMLVEPPPPSSYRNDVSPELQAICLKAMAKQAANRYPTMKDLAAAISDYLRQSTAPARDVTAARAALRAKETRPSTGDHLAKEMFADLAPSSVNPRSIATKKRPRFELPPWPWLAAVGGFALLALAMIGVLYVSTNKGTIRIELSDATAEVEIRVDGDTVLLSGLDEPLKLKPGDHDLVITGKNFETVSKSFTVKRGKNPVLRVSLQDKPVAQGADRSNAADGGWISIRPTAEEIVGKLGNWYKDGIFTIRNLNGEYESSIGSRGIGATDLIMRVVAKKGEGKGLALGLRHSKEGYYSANFDGREFCLTKLTSEGGKNRSTVLKKSALPVKVPSAGSSAIQRLRRGTGFSAACFCVLAGRSSIFFAVASGFLV